MSLEVRAAREEDVPGWLLAMSTAFLQPPVSCPEEIAHHRAEWDPARTQGAFDDGRCVATFRSFAQELTVVGGARVPSDAVTNVTVLPTHRRRGLLSRMMERDLRAAKERGDVVSSLIAAEYPIYGRFGYGPATWATTWSVDVARAGLDPRYAAPESGGRVEFVTPAEVRALGPELYDRFRARMPGAVSRPAGWWERATGAVRFPQQAWTEPLHALYRSSSGVVEGLVTYRTEQRWEAQRPQNTARVEKLIATTPAAERALWHFLCSIDWILHVETGNRAPDDLLPQLLGDPRAAAVGTHADFLWLRPLDVPRLLEARTYPVPGTLVLAVEDRMGLAGGRFRLEAGPEGAVCAPTSAAPDLSLGAAELGSLYLGGTSASRLAALGAVREERQGALGVADALLYTARRPWCPDIF